MRLATVLLVGLLVLVASPAQAANRIEGYVTYAAGGKYGYAVNATVEVVNADTGRVVDRRVTGVSGEYTAFAKSGRYYVRAYYHYFGGHYLTGRNCCLFFRGSIASVRGVNILVRPQVR